MLINYEAKAKGAALPAQKTLPSFLEDRESLLEKPGKMKGMSAPAVHEQWQVPHNGGMPQKHVPLRNRLDLHIIPFLDREAVGEA